jgi:hypothetical protein
MPPAGIEPAIPASARPTAHALDRAATGIGTHKSWYGVNFGQTGSTAEQVSLNTYVVYSNAGKNFQFEYRTVQTNWKNRCSDGHMKVIPNELMINNY